MSKTLKSNKGKATIRYKKIPIRLLVDFSVENLKATREWHDIFKEMKGKTLQARTFYPARL